MVLRCILARCLKRVRKREMFRGGDVRVDVTSERSRDRGTEKSRDGETEEDGEIRESGESGDIERSRDRETDGMRERETGASTGGAVAVAFGRTKATSVACKEIDEAVFVEQPWVLVLLLAADCKLTAGGE